MDAQDGYPARLKPKTNKVPPARRVGYSSVRLQFCPRGSLMY